MIPVFSSVLVVLADGDIRDSEVKQQSLNDACYSG